MKLKTYLKSLWLFAIGKTIEARILMFEDLKKDEEKN